MTPDTERAVRMACKTLTALSISSLPIDPMMILSFCRNTAVHTYDELMVIHGMTNRSAFKYDCMSGRDAITVCQPIGGRDAYEVFFDSHVRPLRRRFTLAHELGHIILRHPDRSPSEEREADVFASHLLAPRPVIDLMLEKALPVSPAFIAETFLLSRSAAQLALRRAPVRIGPDQVYLLRRQFDAFVSSLPSPPVPHPEYMRFSPTVYRSPY